VGTERVAVLSLELPDEMVAFAVFPVVFPVTWHQEQRQAAHALGRAVRSRGDSCEFRPGITGEVLVPRQTPGIP
jgi:hypothetical protein